MKPAFPEQQVNVAERRLTLDLDDSVQGGAGFGTRLLLRPLERRVTLRGRGRGLAACQLPVTA